MIESVEVAAHRPILVVDDDDAVRAYFCTALRHAGFSVLQAADGEQALIVLSTHEVAAVLLDSTMPVLDGPSTLAAIRANPATRLLPVLFVTGNDDLHERIARLEAGADDYLTKPIEAEELVARVRAHLRGRASWRQLLETRLAARGRVAQELGLIRPGGHPETVADAACACLAKLFDDTAVAIIAFGTDGRAASLSTHGAFGEDLRTGRLPAILSRRLFAQATGGPWVERCVAALPGEAALPLTGTLPAAGFAPLRTEGRLLGLLAVALGGNIADEGGEDHGDRCLAAAIDFAPLVSALLAPSLIALGAVDARRRAVRELLTQGAFLPHFQPIVDLVSHRVVGYEALTRFDDDTPPNRWFAEASQVGLGVELEATTAAAAVRASRRLPADAWLSLNVSPAFVADGERLGTVLEGAGRPLVLELTEHDPIDDYPAILAALEDLAVEVRLSVDDAGSGYACLRHILALRPDYVKLDRGWVSGIDEDPARQALVVGLSAFAERTDGVLIAEGIELPAERETLAGLGVPLGQGYLLGRPRAARGMGGAERVLLGT